METTYFCAYCGEENDLAVDPTAGTRQEYVEDCQVCCHPNRLLITFGGEDDDVVVQADRESD
ncbi:MAG TPA: CPXCG motif-containing cysteine-rich protein [bacterium]|nr:CPXCG motif-containing cysteine-rich protein [bacterium]